MEEGGISICMSFGIEGGDLWAHHVELGFPVLDPPPADFFWTSRGAGGRRRPTG